MRYRFKALAKQREPDELDTPAELSAPRGWVALLALAVIMAAALVWAMFGRLSQTVSADGLITRLADAVQVQSLYTGIVTGIHASIGSQVLVGQDLAVVRDARGITHDVTSAFAGQVISLEVADGMVIGTGTTVATVERDQPGSAEPVAMLFVSPSQAAGITPGQSVGLAVASAPSAVFGLLIGRVAAISQFPLTEAEAAILTGAPGGAGAPAGAEGNLLVTVDLRKDGHTASGYAWTTASGPPQVLPALVPVTGTITLGVQSPISLLFGR